MVLGKKRLKNYFSSCHLVIWVIIKSFNACLQKNTGQNGGKPKLDLNVAAAWAQGITGKNITTAIMDDGVDYMHPDLINNYVRRICFI